MLSACFEDDIESYWNWIYPQLGSVKKKFLLEYLLQIIKILTYEAKMG